MRVAVLRHPMPYGDLARQAVQRFETLRGPRRRRLHDRGARGVRAASRRGQPRLRRHRLRGHPRPGGEGGRRDPLGRREQRHAVHRARPPHRRRRPAPAGPRAPLPPRRDQPPHGRRLRRQQDRQRAARGRRGRAGLDPRAQPAARDRPRASPIEVEGDPERDPRQARARRRGRPDAHARRHGATAPPCWPRSSTAPRRSSTRGRSRSAPSGDVRHVPALVGAPAGDGLRPGARWRSCARRSPAPTPTSSSSGRRSTCGGSSTSTSRRCASRYHLDEIGEPTLADILRARGIAAPERGPHLIARLLRN